MFERQIPPSIFLGEAARSLILPYLASSDTHFLEARVWITFS
jgi:hypothetical protein